MWGLPAKYQRLVKISLKPKRLKGSVFFAQRSKTFVQFTNRIRPYQRLSRNNTTSNAFVYNSRLDPFQTEKDFQKVDYIILGDFPGKPETVLGMYFAGNTGKELLAELERLLVNDGEYNCHKFLILNKTFLSKSVNDNQLPADVAKEAQKYMATLAYCCYQNINKNRREEDYSQIWIFGDDYQDEDEYKYFYEQLAKEFAGSGEENIYVFPHPLYGNLYASLPGNGTILDVTEEAEDCWQIVKPEMNSW